MADDGDEESLPPELTARQGLAIIGKGGNVHKSNDKATAKRRAKNKAARKARKGRHA